MHIYHGVREGCVGQDFSTRRGGFFHRKGLLIQEVVFVLVLTQDLVQTVFIPRRFADWGSTPVRTAVAAVHICRKRLQQTQLFLNLQTFVRTLGFLMCFILTVSINSLRMYNKLDSVRKAVEDGNNKSQQSQFTLVF